MCHDPRHAPSVPRRRTTNTWVRSGSARHRGAGWPDTPGPKREATTRPARSGFSERLRSSSTVPSAPGSNTVQFLHQLRVLDFVGPRASHENDIGARRDADVGCGRAQPSFGPIPHHCRPDLPTRHDCHSRRLIVASVSYVHVDVRAASHVPLGEHPTDVGMSPKPLRLPESQWLVRRSHPHDASNGQPLAALGASALEGGPPCPRLHAGTKSVAALTPSVLRLVGALHRRSRIRSWQRRHTKPLTAGGHASRSRGHRHGRETCRPCPCMHNETAGAQPAGRQSR